MVQLSSSSHLRQNDCLSEDVTWHRWRNTIRMWAGGLIWWPWTPQWCSGPSRTWSAKSGRIASCSAFRASVAVCYGSRPSWPRVERSVWSGPFDSSCCTPWMYAPPSPRWGFSMLSEGKMQFGLTAATPGVPRLIKPPVRCIIKGLANSNLQPRWLF